jgi:hypothetical protein
MKRMDVQRPSCPGDLERFFDPIPPFEEMSALEVDPRFHRTALGPFDQVIGGGKVSEVRHCPALQGEEFSAIQRSGFGWFRPVSDGQKKFDRAALLNEFVSILGLRGAVCSVRAPGTD